MAKYKVGDKVTTKRDSERWATVTRVTSPENPIATKLDIRYSNGQVETGLPIGSIDKHVPA